MKATSKGEVTRSGGQGRRVAALAIAAACGILAFSQALSNQRSGALDRLSLPNFRNPVHALAGVPTGAAQGKPFFLPNPAAAARIAKQTLASSPLEPSALLLLALADGPEQRQAALAKGFLAERLSRRHPGVQLWLLQARLGAGPVRPALVHIDRLLKVNPEMAAQVFPVLAQGLQDSALRRVIVGEIERGAAWGADFIFYVGAEPALAPQTAQMLLAMRRIPPGDAARDGVASVLKNLADQGSIGLLYPLAKRYGANESDDFATNFAQTEGMVPFAWEPAADADFGADISRSKPQTVELAGWVNPERYGTVARKLVWFTPGAWRLSWDKMTQVGGASSEAFWRIRCMTKAGYREQAASADLYASKSARSFSFDVPADCQAALIALAVRGSVDNDVTEIQFSGLRLTKASVAESARDFTKSASLANAARDLGKEP